MNKAKLPADPLSIILGILGIVIVIGGSCCYGIPAIISLIVSIIALVYSNKSLNEYAVNPDLYAPNSRSNVYIGKILNIISIVLSSIWILIVVGFLLVYGTLFASIFSQMNNVDTTWEWENEEYYDENGYYYDDSEDSLFIEEENDSLYFYQDSIQIEEVE